MKKIMTTRAVAVVTMAVIVIVASAGPAIGCPSCGKDIAQNKGLADGLNYTILGMMSMPFLLFGTMVGVFYRAYRRYRR
jgi:hypothetical protein